MVHISCHHSNSFCNCVLIIFPVAVCVSVNEREKLRYRNSQVLGQPHGEFEVWSVYAHMCVCECVCTRYVTLEL